MNLMEQTRDTNRMVEEMMLLANTTVAGKILDSFPACACLRRHPPPDPRKFEALQVALESTGISLDLTSSRTLADSLDKAVMKSDPFFNTLVRMMTTRCLNEVCNVVSGRIFDFWAVQIDIDCSTVNLLVVPSH